MIIDLPNGLNISQLRLREVLYTPDVTYTLISVGRLDDLGYTVKFAHGVCSISPPDGEWIAQILKDEKGLYRITCEPEDAATAEVLTLDQFH